MAYGSPVGEGRGLICGIWESSGPVGEDRGLICGIWESSG